MATYVNDLRLKEIATGDESGTWGTSTNTNLELIAEAFSFGTESITTNADTHTTTIADGATDPGRSIYLQYTGTLDSTCTITIGPNTVSKLWFIENATSGSQDIIIKQGSGATVTVPNGKVKAIYSDGAGSGGKMVDAFTDLHVGGSFFVTTSDQDEGITVECTNGGASAGPSLKLDRNSSSPADSDPIGEIEFSGRNDASETIQYARISSTIIDASDGTEDGSLNIRAMLNGTTKSRFLSNATETVINDGSQDLDFRVETDTDANALFVQGSTNRVMLGFNANVAVANINPHLSVVGTDNGGTAIGIARYSADTSGPRFVLSKSRNGSITTAGGTVVQSGDTTGLIQFSGDDGSDMASRTARIQSQVAATPGSNDMPGLLQFFTTADGAASETERMRITEGGDLLYNTTTDYGGKVNIKADASGSSESCLALVSTLASAADGPILDLIRQTASPADSDNTGLIRFKSTNSADETVAYAEIDTFTQDVTDGTEDGMIRIRTILNGTLRSRIEFDQTETVINEEGQALDFRVETDGVAKMLFVDGTNNKVLIGTDTSITGYAVAPLQVSGTQNANTCISIARFSNNANAPVLNFVKSRDTSIGGNTIVADGDNLGSILFNGNDGDDSVTSAARILGEVDGTPGANDMPGRLVFSTTPDGSTSLDESMRINNSGDLLINTTTDFGGKVNIARADNNTTLALVCTDNDAADGPILDFIRDSSTPATTDDIAHIKFKANDSDGNRDTFANIEVFSTGVTSGSEEATIQIRSLVSGTELQRLKFSNTEAVFNEEGADLNFRVESDTSTHCLFVNAGTNKVGIKTSSPDGQLHIHTATAGSVSAPSTADELVLENDSSAGMSILTPNTNVGSVQFGDPDDNNVGMLQYAHNTDDMIFTVNGAEAMRISSDRVLLVNTTADAADDMTANACHIASNATTTRPTLIVDDSDTSVESGSICMAVMFSNDNSFSGGKYISFRDLGGEQGSVSGDGAGSVAYNTSSDMRLKTNIQDTASQWDTIKALQVRDYEWIANGNEETGFIAQEIHEQIPQVVRVGGEEAAKEPWSVDYGRITPQLTKALQEAMARIETLESELAKLKGGS